MDPLIIVGRFKQAFEHPSEEARKRYLEQHPQADPKRHTVKEKSEEGGEDGETSEEDSPEEDAEAKPEKDESEEVPEKAKAPTEKPEGKPEAKPDKEEAPKAKGGLFKRLSEKAKSFLSHSSAEVQKFVSDAGHRKQVLKSATQTIKDSPKTYAKRIISTAKEEVHEFKEAGSALKQVLKGKELNHHQKKALKTVAIHMSVAVAAAALTSTGVLAGSVAFGKGMAQKVAMKAALKSLENVHLLNEVSHIGHGLHHLIASQQQQGTQQQGGGDEGGDLDPEEAFATLVMQMTLKELENLDDDTLAEALEVAAGEQEKLAWKVGAVAPNTLPTVLQTTRQALEDLKIWADRSLRVLLAARSEAEGLPPDRVWQDRFVRYFEQADPFFAELEKADSVLDDIFLDSQNLGNIANLARQAIRIPRKAQVTYAIADIDFAPNPLTGRQGISYSVPRLKEWAGELSTWAQGASANLLDLARKASRVRP